MSGRIGPNAIIRLREVMLEEMGPGPTARLLRDAGLSRYVDTLPDHMVEEAEVVALHGTLRRSLPKVQSARLAFQAGVRTADYLLAHRIPKTVQRLLKLLPASLASRLLLAAIGRHAWTFAGTGRFTVEDTCPAVVSIADCPTSRGLFGDRPQGEFYSGTFQRLFQVLVHSDARVSQTHCESIGDPCSRWQIRW
jgi:divinyl protochlorophyllide a 8-vinyl-reductase